MKKTLLIAAAITCFAFTGKEYNNNYIEVVNTLEDMQEWLVADIQGEQIDQEIGFLYLENIDECLMRLEKMRNQNK